MRNSLTLLAILSLSGCAGGGTFLEHAAWPFGNPNAPSAHSEMAQRATGKHPTITALYTQPGNVWPGPVEPFPTISQVEKDSNLPLGAGYTPSLPSPYPPGKGKQINGAEDVTLGPALYPPQNSAQPASSDTQ